MNSYTNSCAIIRFPCRTGQSFINPCDCASYLQCNQGNSIITRLCPGGTAWDHVTRLCQRTSQVIDKRCELDSPWERCQSVAYHQAISTLERQCTGTSTTDSTTTTGSNGGGGGGGGAVGGDDDNSGGGDTNTGAVVGGVLGGLLAVIIVGVIVYFVIKKMSPSSFRGRREAYKTSSTSRADQSAQIDDVYDVIDDNEVSLPKAHTNVGYDLGKKPEGNPYNNIPHGSVMPVAVGQDKNGPTRTYSALKPETYSDIDKPYATLNASTDDNLSRSISINGQEVLVQDAQGYFIGYPSGTVPRQPSPLPLEAMDVEDETYSLGQAPGYLETDDKSAASGRTSPKYFVLQTPSEARNT